MDILEFRGYGEFLFVIVVKYNLSKDPSLECERYIEGTFPIPDCDPYFTNIYKHGLFIILLPLVVAERNNLK